MKQAGRSLAIPPHGKYAKNIWKNTQFQRNSTRNIYLRRRDG